MGTIANQNVYDKGNSEWYVTVVDGFKQYIIANLVGIFGSEIDFSYYVNAHETLHRKGVN